MTTTLEKAFRNVSDLTEEIGLPIEKRTSTTLKHFICLSTDKKSLKNAKKLFEKLKEIKSILTTEKLDIKHEHLKDMLETTNEILVEVNSMFGFIKNIFKLDGVSGAEVTIDDDTMIEFLATMEKSKYLMSDISDYLQLVLNIEKINKEEKKAYTPEELANLFKVA